MTPNSVLELFDSLVAPVRDAVHGVADPTALGTRPGQYALDLVADGEILGPLVDAGLGVLSEESGVIEGEGDLAVIVDPVDGSTNAALGLPWYALSLCAVDGVEPVAALVANLASGRTYRATRGGGASVDGVLLPIRAPIALADAIVGVSGLPPGDLGWAQFRAYGAAALDLCAVAAGELHGFVDCNVDAHGVWDYAAASLICAESGVDVVDAHGRELITLDHRARRTPVAGPTELVAELLAARSKALA